jgi:hypothetical protein
MANTWTPLANQNGFANGMWLLQDGRVLVNVDKATQLFFLGPDANGSYVNSQFDPSAGNFLAQKEQFASVILSDGRLVTCGGENSSEGMDTTFCEIYDPTTRTSSPFPPPAGWSSIGDSPAIVLTDGTVLLANALGQPAFATLNQYSLAWTEKDNIFSDNEYGLVLLKTGDVLKASVEQQTSYRYNAGKNAFVQDANPPVMLGSTSTEIGPAMTLMDGRTIWFGATDATAIYTPAGFGQNGSWSPGPSLIDQNGVTYSAGDAPAVLEPNGKVLVRLRAITPALPGVFMEFDPSDNSISVDPSAPPFPNAGSTTLLLPNGHALVSLQDFGWYDVTFDGPINPFWAPAIIFYPEIVTAGARTYLTGTQLCGLSECSNFGDDNQQAENYPMVRFVDANGNQTYGRAHDIDVRAISPGTLSTVAVEVPETLPPGTYSLFAVAMGIPSNSVQVTVIEQPPTLAGRVGDIDGDSLDEIVVTSPWGIGVLKQSDTTMSVLTMAANGTRLGEWVIDTTRGQIGPVGDFDGDGSDEIFVSSPWGIGVLKFDGTALTSVVMIPNGTILAGGALNTRGDSFGPLVNVGNITDGIFYANTQGVGLLVLSGGALTLSNFYNYDEPIGASTQWAFQTDNRFGPVGDFDGDGVNEIVVMSNSALGIVKFAAEWTPIVVVGNGEALPGGWRVDTTNNQFFAGGADGGQLIDPLMVVSPWGVGILQYQPAGPAANATLLTVFIAANGTALSVPAAFPPVPPWIVNTATDQFGPAWRDEIGNTYVLIRNDSAFGILSPRLILGDPQPGADLICEEMAVNQTQIQGFDSDASWTVDTTDNVFGSVGQYDSDTQGMFIASPWGVGICAVGFPLSITMLAANGSRFGQWLVNTNDDVY